MPPVLGVYLCPRPAAGAVPASLRALAPGARSSHVWPGSPGLRCSRLPRGFPKALQALLQATFLPRARGLLRHSFSFGVVKLSAIPPHPRRHVSAALPFPPSVAQAGPDRTAGSGPGSPDPARQCVPRGLFTWGADE